MFSVYFEVIKISSFLVCNCKSVICRARSQWIGKGSDKHMLLVLSKTRYIFMAMMKEKMAVEKKLMKKK